MDKIEKSFVKCSCGHRFPSPIFFGSVAVFESATTSGNSVQCPSCRKMFACNKDNMSYVLTGNSGGSVGDDFGKSDD